jgi:hypothetical protein
MTWLRPHRFALATLVALPALLPGRADAARAAKAPAQETAAERPALDGIFEAFEHADIVTLGERPWSRVDSDFRHQVLMDPRLTAKVNDVVVEFANARYQSMIDRYVLDLALIPPDSLRLVWQDASEPGAWDSPVYGYLLDTVRRANQHRPREERVRVLAGEPPIDWSRVESAADIAAYGPRGAHALDVIAREVVEKKRKALLVYQERNFFRRDRGLSPAGNLTTNLEARHPGLKVFVIATAPAETPMHAQLDSALTTSVRPVLVNLAQSKLGAWPASRLFDFGRDLLADGADALLYYGRVIDFHVRPSDRVTRDLEYVREVERRKGLLRR